MNIFTAFINLFRTPKPPASWEPIVKQMNVWAAEGYIFNGASPAPVANPSGITTLTFSFRSPDRPGEPPTIQHTCAVGGVVAGDVTLG